MGREGVGAWDQPNPFLGGLFRGRGRAASIRSIQAVVVCASLIDRFRTRTYRSKWRRPRTALASGSRPPRCVMSRSSSDPRIYSLDSKHTDLYDPHPPKKIAQPGQQPGTPFMYLPGDVVRGKLRANVKSRTTARAVRMKVGGPWI